MYAVIETGGKQYRVELGNELAVERLDGAPGDTINFDRVLLVADGDSAQIGTPTVSEALVTADVVRQDRGEKLIVFKYRPKARRRVKKGHRQEQTVLRIADIRFNGRSAADEAGAQEKQESKERKAAAAEAERKATADQALAAKLAEEAAATATAESTEATTKSTRTTSKAKTASKAETTADAEVEADAETGAARSDAAAEPAAKPAAKPRARRTTTKKDE